MKVCSAGVLRSNRLNSDVLFCRISSSFIRRSYEIQCETGNSVENNKCFGQTIFQFLKRNSTQESQHHFAELNSYIKDTVHHLSSGGTADLRIPVLPPQELASSIGTNPLAGSDFLIHWLLLMVDSSHVSSLASHLSSTFWAVPECHSMQTSSSLGANSWTRWQPSSTKLSSALRIKD